MGSNLPLCPLDRNNYLLVGSIANSGENLHMGITESLANNISQWLTIDLRVPDATPEVPMARRRVRRNGAG